MISDAHDGTADDGRRADSGRWGADEADRPLRRREPEAVDELGLFVGPEEEVDSRIPAPQTGPVRLADRTTRQDDAESRVGGLQPGQLALTADDLLFGGLADRARVDDD